MTKEDVERYERFEEQLESLKKIQKNMVEGSKAGFMRDEDTLFNNEGVKEIESLMENIEKYMKNL